ncbi:MAG: dicarboxylate/amino acid:cation symporter [Bacteroidota bacterium]|nr:dicarboxylate/amino acid:cation symporter [Bacteroidota bacterium]
MAVSKYRLPLHSQIFIGMIVGILGGIIVKYTVGDKEIIGRIIAWIAPVGDIFMNFIFMMVIPLILSALTMGVSEVGDLGKLGRLGWKMLRYTIIVTAISVFIGLALVTIVQPGKSLSIENREALSRQYEEKAEKIQSDAVTAKERSIGEIITNIVPRNPIAEMVYAFDPGHRGGGLLAVMFFSLVLGIALASSDQEKVKPVKDFLAGLYEVVMKVIQFAMKLAPFGVAALLFELTVELGISILMVLLQYVLLVIGALALHMFVTYSLILKYFSGMSPMRFFRDIKEVMVTAFSTSSSNATLPIAIKTSIEKLRIKKDISHFVLTIGSTANQNGTALYEGITVLFLAQCFGVELDMYDQIIVLVTCILAGVGTAGVPGGSLPVIVLILISVGVPGKSIALIYGVDRILDMCRTVLNVTGDLTAAAYINHSENKHLQEKAPDSESTAY